jgi:hypothetical protein
MGLNLWEPLSWAVPRRAAWVDWRTPCCGQPLFFKEMRRRRILGRLGGCAAPLDCIDISKHRSCCTASFTLALRFYNGSSSVRRQPRCLHSEPECSPLDGDRQYSLSPSALSHTSCSFLMTSAKEQRQYRTSNLQQVSRRRSNNRTKTMQSKMQRLHSDWMPLQNLLRGRQRPRSLMMESSTGPSYRCTIP